jgi:Predicted metal-binding integral membrane protein (DUF2182)
VPSRRARWRQYRWQRPDWWVSVLVAAAWAFVFVDAGFRTHADRQGPEHGGVAALAGDGGDEGRAAAFVWWLLMVVAMMVPLAGKDARWLAHRTLARRRARVVALHVIGYTLVWLSAGAAVVAAVDVAEPARGMTALVLAAAAAWHVTARRRQALRRCGAGRVSAVEGFRADTDCLHAGMRTGWRCLVTCGLAMAAMAASHNPALMAGVAGVSANERRRAPNPERRIGRPREAAALLALAVAVAAGVFPTY